MSIKLAILGILSWKPATGYDVKKIIEESLFMHWSGNNNQIYRSLVQLLDEELVTSEILHQESSPSKKMYTITQKGERELKNWVQSSPQLPESKSSFLNQLAWADQLSPSELNDLLMKYEEEVSLHVVLLQEKMRRGLFSPTRTQREIFIWNRINEHVIASYKNEWFWVHQLRKELGATSLIKEENHLDVTLIEKGGITYLSLLSAQTPLATEQDALNLIALCMEHQTDRVMISAEALSEDFFQLRTGVAGAILQKLVNYQIQAAAVIPDQRKNTGRFKEMVQEANKGSHFRVFSSISDAENWLIPTND